MSKRTNICAHCRKKLMRVPTKYYNVTITGRGYICPAYSYVVQAKNSVEAITKAKIKYAWEQRPLVRSVKQVKKER